MRFLNYVFLLLVMSIFSSCSLLKVSVESGVIPLSKQELNTRMAVRGFYYDFTNGVEEVSDSIIKNTYNDEIKINALKLKLSATNVCTQTVYQTIPKSSLLDTWVFCKQLDVFCKTSDLNNLLGENYTWMQKEAEDQYKHISKIAKALCSHQEYQQLKDFVDHYVETHPQLDLSFSAVSTSRELIEYLQIPDSTYVQTVGSSAEVFNDLTDRLGVYNSQIRNQVAWQKDIWAIEWKQDTLAHQFLAKADSISVLLKDLAIIAQESPEMMGIIAIRMREELSPLVSDLNSGLYNTALQISSQREDFQKYMDEQRSFIVDDINKTGTAFIQETSDGIAHIIKKSAFMLILLVIVLVLVLFGMPFTIGFYIAKLKFRKKL